MKYVVPIILWTLAGFSFGYLLGERSNGFIIEGLNRVIQDRDSEIKTAMEAVQKSKEANENAISVLKAISKQRDNVMELAKQCQEMCK